jgi:hypothetical protein
VKRYRATIRPNTTHVNYDGFLGEAVIVFYCAGPDMAGKIAYQYADVLGGNVDSIDELA